MHRYLTAAALAITTTAVVYGWFHALNTVGDTLLHLGDM